MRKQDFQELLWQKSRELYREMPWRSDPTFYHVLVSEVMLQQTQVGRVLVKYDEFMQAFPSIDDLAGESLSEVLIVWQGLGYNRRAKYLHEAAKMIAQSGEPSTIGQLVALPGVGHNTAAAIMNYVQNIPVPFVETNIRTVYLNHFFDRQTDITDKQILRVVTETMDLEHPREWFWVLMDYGAQLKANGAGNLRESRHYKKQSPLKGSVREVRGQIVKALAAGDKLDAELKHLVRADDRFDMALDGLLRDGLISRAGIKIHLTK